MGSRSDRVKTEARYVVDALKVFGAIEPALRIERLLKSHAAAIATLKVLHRDNMELRKQLGLPSFLDERKADET